LVKTGRIFFNSETWFILLTTIGEYEPAGAARLFLNRFDAGLKTKWRQETNPDAVKTTNGTKLRHWLLPAFISLLLIFLLQELAFMFTVTRSLFMESFP